MLTEKTNKIIEELNELKKIVEKQFSFDMLKDMDEYGMVAMAKSIKLMDMSMDLAKEQAKVMDEINDKLDTLLERTEKGSN